MAPFRESGYRLLMRALSARGNPAEALLVYDRLQRLLREELGLPSEQTRRLHGYIVGP
jgi:pentatricopeptide repeat protein